MNEGDVVISPFRMAGGGVKNRPAVLLRVMPPFGDFLICGISQQLRQEVAGFDELISSSDADFQESGLLNPSLIRLGYLALLPEREFLGDIGSISSTRHRRLLRRLGDYLALPSAQF